MDPTADFPFTPKVGLPVGVAADSSWLRLLTVATMRMGHIS